MWQSVTSLTGIGAKMTKQARIFLIITLVGLSVVAFPTGSFGPDDGLVVSVPAFIGAAWLFGGIFK